MPGSLTKMLPDLSPSVSILLGCLVQAPIFRLDPYFLVFLVVGLAWLVVSICRFVQKKHNWYVLIWHFLGIGLAGFVLVYWARYDSAGASVFMEMLIVAALAIATYFMRRSITNWYGRFRPLVWLGIISCALLPLVGISQNLGEAPVVAVSPSSKFIHTLRPGGATNLNVTIASAYADAWDFRMTAESPDVLVAYLDGRQKGPIEIPFLERNRETHLRMRIEASPVIANGTYRVVLGFSYRDFVRRKFDRSDDVQVIIGAPSVRACVIATATYGSEMSKEVQFLRYFRDNTVRRTFAGSSFLSAFETFYYSFSPSIAALISESSLLRVLARALIYPLVESLCLASLVFNSFSLTPELGVVMAGLSAGTLIGIVYLSPVAIIMLLVSKRRILKNRSHTV